MNLELLLSWLSSDSTIQRVRAARELKKNNYIEYVDEIRNHYHKEEVPWVKEALSSLLFQYVNYAESNKNNSTPTCENNSYTEDIEAIQSAAVSDSIGQVLHEIEPVIGALKVVARDEIENYKESKLKKEFERLDELLQTFENWRRVEQTPRYTKSNIYELARKQINHDIRDEVEVKINIPKDLEFATDQALLRIIFSNAVRNAIDATLNIDSYKRRPIVVSAGRSETGLWASVVDNGIGLPNGEKLILSGRCTTKPGHRGMGLAIVTKAINALNGNWDLKDGKIGGAVFFFEIPTKEEQ